MNSCLPDYVGFVLTPSKRRVSVDDAAELAKLLKPEILRVGVFAKESPEEVAAASRRVPLDGIQLHMDIDDAYLDRLIDLLAANPSEKRPFIWLRISVPADASDASSIRSLSAGNADPHRADAILLDTRAGARDGGTGVRFPAEPALAYLREEGLLQIPIVLAGGLRESNVEEAIREFGPEVVDVSGGVEEDGFKDFARVIRFIEAVRKVGTT